MRDGRRQTADGRQGMTLVELMVVTSIVLLLVVISVPVVRPMLMSRKQADAAQMLSIYLNSARNRAIETGRDCGVMFERYTDNNINGTIFPNNDSCLVVRQIQVPPPYMGMNPNVRVAVIPSGVDIADIAFYKWDNGWTASSEETPYWNKMVQKGDKIQFDNQGPFYTIVQPFSAPGQPPQIAVRDSLKASGEPEDFNLIRPIPPDSPATFKMLRRPTSGTPQLTLTPPIGFPSGIIVDLFYSGIESGAEESHEDGTLPKLNGIYPSSDFEPQQPSGPSSAGNDTDPVIVMFSPSGAVSLVHSGGQIRNNGPIHFLIGRWDRAGRDWQGDEPFDHPYPPEDGLRNYQDLSNFWVTIDQTTGRVRTNPVAPHDSDSKRNPLYNSRRYAIQSQ